VLPFAKAILLGFSVAAPVGPIGLLCIQRTLSGGRALGLATGLGAAAADTLYGAAAVLGLGVASNALLAHSTFARIVGALFLAYLAVRTFTRIPARGSSSAGAPASVGAAWASTLALTLTNPLTVLSFAAMFTALQTPGEARGWESLLLPLGVFIGSAAWWLTLSTVVGLVRDRLLQYDLRWVNRGAGILLMGFAAWSALSAMGVAV
jgi:threonine/homoserine/homoserine lactone efflux protein